VDVELLRGGLESVVARARVSGPREHGSIPPRFVIKKLPAGLEREADVYEVLWRHLDSPPAVRMFGREVAARGTYIYLEEAHSFHSWPWTDPQSAGAVCRALARLHDSRALPQEVFVWDYDAALARSARSTLELAHEACDAGGRRLWRRPGDLRRIVSALPRMRQRLLSGETSVIHGDMHPGNVIVRGSVDHDVVMIDWARSRLGSPLEDVASWLHSLGCWEPEARRRHDTLMRTYLDARRTRQRFGSDMRVDYWLASACNGLSGAVRYHLSVLSNKAVTDAARYDSERALIAWQRVARRTASLLSTNLDRCR
jgi:aminoglycoside phosphotransferase (APT) family kinase protein